MSEYWAQRKRDTNKLVGIAADYVLSQKIISPEQLYGLCRLTWTTQNNQADDAPYIGSTKIPALGMIFGRDYSGWSLNEVADDISDILRSPVSSAVLAHTGFTHFYRAYRNSSLGWIQQNIDTLLPLFRKARDLSTDAQGLELVRSLEVLPTIPKANHADNGMRPEYLLTPAFFSMDRRIRFPLINGNPGVRALLAALEVPQASLSTQYQRMIELYGRGGITDAADLDEIGGDLPDFVDLTNSPPTKKLLEEQPTEDGTELPEKDENDVLAFHDPATKIKRRIHNGLTNKLRRLLPEYTLYEGCRQDIKFDVMVKGYDSAGANDLLIEVKSSIEAPHIRMAIGQVFDYWFRLNGQETPHVAILLPAPPGSDSIALLEYLEIGVLWFSGEQLYTCSEWLEDFVTSNQGEFIAINI